MTHLNLVESDFEKMEKLVLPRFPFCYLTFKDTLTEHHVYEVQDISKTGMQLCLKNGDHQYKVQDEVAGHLSWLGNKVDLFGQVRWVRENRLGVEFVNNPKLQTSLGDFLTMENFMNAMKPVHKVDYGTALPANLKFWLSADGPVQILIWNHNDGEISHFQVLIMEHFVEWRDGKGLRSGRVISKRDQDTPLINSDEFVFSIDEFANDERIEMAKELIKNIDQKKLPEEIIQFLKIKIGL